jgi:hypothetical protein
MPKDVLEICAKVRDARGALLMLMAQERASGRPTPFDICITGDVLLAFAEQLAAMPETQWKQGEEVPPRLDGSVGDFLGSRLFLVEEEGWRIYRKEAT